MTGAAQRASKMTEMVMQRELKDFLMVMFAKILRELINSMIMKHANYMHSMQVFIKHAKITTNYKNVQILCRVTKLMEIPYSLRDCFNTFV